ncbi:AMP-binding protein [Streptomyces sp. NPDC006668]|uniref:(2,3-dihydroxybenzoyl)adenylate synthase n=1 Tax=Streptomyces sp. NPDC006668 TaxID=3156903 RepID=UPI001054A9E8
MIEGCTPWPREFAERYRAQGYWAGEDLSGLLRQWSRTHGERTALVHTGRRITYTELDRRVDRTAAGFLQQGIEAGDRVVVQLPNVPEFVIVCFALFRVGALPVFALLAHRANEIRHLCDLSGAVGYVVPGDHRGFDFTALAASTKSACPALRRVFVLDGSGADGGFTALADVDAEPVEFPAPDPSDVAFFLLSGGTTALPKLIPRTHDDYVHQTRVTADIVGLTRADTYLAVLPVEFNFAWGCPGVIGTLGAGGTVVLVDDADPDDCFDAIARERVTFTSLVPTVVHVWLDAAETMPCDTSSLRLIQVGGAPLQRELAERIEPAFDCRLQQVFGMAEGLISVTRDSDTHGTVMATQGRPVSPGDEIRVVDESGARVAPGHAGELLARGPYTLRGYYRAPEHNARAFTQDGFYCTGDLARITAEGNLVIEGRIKDVIIRAGNKISATEVEGHLLGHPAVGRVAVVPVPDDFLGERICAYVQPVAEAPTLQALRDALHERGIADYKLPDLLEIVDRLPLTGLGKVDKKLLAKDVAAKADALRKD